MEQQALLDNILSQSTPTEFLSIHSLHENIHNPHLPYIFLFFGPSASGKNSVIEKLKELDFIEYATTATSRERRDGEAESTYIWMRKQLALESREEYYKNLVREYELVEYDVHSENLYGLPKVSIENALLKKAAVIQTNYSGVRTIKRLFSDKANVIAFSIHCEKWSDLVDRMKSLGRNDIEERIKESTACLENTLSVADYLILNSFEDGMLPKIQQSLKDFITAVVK